jgi:hypothetical protein
MDSDAIFCYKLATGIFLEYRPFAHDVTAPVTMHVEVKFANYA